jgi:hypothetical protein
VIYLPQQLVVLVDEVVGDAASQPDHQVVFPWKIVDRGSCQCQPVGADGFRFANRCGKIEPGQVRDLVNRVPAAR